MKLLIIVIVLVGFATTADAHRKCKRVAGIRTCSQINHTHGLYQDAADGVTNVVANGVQSYGAPEVPGANGGTIYDGMGGVSFGIIKNANDGHGHWDIVGNVCNKDMISDGECRDKDEQ